MEAMDEIVTEFLVESYENLDQLDRDLLALEQNPRSRELLAGVFRTIHTIKGTSGFLAFHKLEQLTHVGENLLSRLRDGRIELDDDRATALLRMVDAVRGLLAAIEATGLEGDADHGGLISTLSTLSADAPSAPPAPAVPPLGEVLVTAGATTADAVEIARMEQGLGDGRPIGSILVDHGSTTPGALETALETQHAQRSLVDSSVRVDVELLDSLMRLVGELVLARNQLVSRLDDDSPDSSGDASLAQSAQRLSVVTSDLQERVMKTRMQPVDAVWSKLPRVVRDLARQCGRVVRLELEGGQTGLDRSVLEAIKDPLTHLVRNAVDHGIEPPEARTSAGKPAEGVLRLRAYHEAGQVHLEIIDDGAGIDPQRIAAKAVERGLVTPAQLSTMTTGEIMNLIFLPGFSTQRTVTNLSGRGVGMDVVKTRIEGIGGSVDVSSTLGHGSTFRLTMPLTLAIIPALTISCGGRRYALPQVSVLELVRLSGEGADGGIELVAGTPVHRLRNALLPLVRLDEQLGLEPLGAADAEDAAAHGRGGFVVVLHAARQRFGLVVDDVLDTQEIVVKPLGRHLQGLPEYAGATILGDGHVVLILDAAALARRSGVLGGTACPAAAQTPVEAKHDVVDPLLVVEIAGRRRAAIPLDMVSRLEEVPATALERVGGREVVQYRGRIMPLVRLSTLLGADRGSSAVAGAGVQLVVHTRGGRSVGLVVERILDIAAERTGTRGDVDDDALVGSVVVGDSVVELLDVERAVLAADPDFYRAPPTPGVEEVVA